MKKILLAAIVLIALGVAATHWYYSDRGRFTTAPEYSGLVRTVVGNVLTSPVDPAVTLRIDPAFEYIGGQKFILYGVADTEQYLFVERHADESLKSVYWIQFEAYLDDNDYSYDYSGSPLRLTIGDYEFYTDTATFHFDPNIERRRGTDGAMVREFLASKGLVYPSELAYARMVYLTDETNRKELMIIFFDDLSRYGVTAAQLEDGGSAAGRRAEIEQAHLPRIRETLSVSN